MAKEVKTGARRKIKPSSYYGWCRWRCERRDGECVVSGYVEATELWQTIAVISGSASTFDEIVRLVELVNGRQDDADLLRLAFESLKAIEEEGYTYATEMELENVIERLEKRVSKSA
jgi:hypothetical protein